MVSAGGESGKKPPESGLQVDVTSDMPDVTGIDFGSVKVEGETIESKEAYKTTMTYQKEGTRETKDVTIHHVPLNEENTNFKGLFKAVVPMPTDKGDQYTGISVVYEKNGDNVSISMRTCTNRAVTSKDFFGTNELVDFSKAACGQNGNYMIAKFNTADNSATAHYAWQAGVDGRGDGATRVFEIYGPSSGNGVAFFGFGDDIKVISATMPWIEGMTCDWLAHIGQIYNSGYAQKQIFNIITKEPVESKIYFAPNDVCWCDGLSSRCNGTFTISAATIDPDPNVSFLYDSRTVDSFSLANAPTDSDVPDVTEPTFTVTSR